MEFRLLSRISLLALSLAALLPSQGAAAREGLSSRWEIGVVFLGTRQSEVDQVEAERKISELAALRQNDFLRVSVHRDLPGAPGFFQPAGAALKFFAEAFTDPSAKRILLIYGHGLGPSGLEKIRLKDLRGALEKGLPKRTAGAKPLDLLWMDSCYMASLEAAYELRGLADYYLASEDQEFSSGTPFRIFQSLSDGPSDPRSVAVGLSEGYLQSYSYLRGGDQREAVYSSPATLSVIETAKLPGLISRLRELVHLFPEGRISPEQRKTLLASAPDRRMTDHPELSDLDWLLAGLRAGLDSKDPGNAPALAKIQEILDLLEFDSPDARESNFRIEVESPGMDDVWMIYGYEEWGRGYEGDEEFLSKLPAELKPASFLPGPGGKKWPARRVEQKLTLTPFVPDSADFRYYFVNGAFQEPVTEEEIYTRVRDDMTYSAGNDSNPLIWIGYTEGVGANAERYSGFSLLDPSLGAANPSYIDLDFAVETGWGNF